MNVREQLENTLYEKGFVKEFIEANGTKLGVLRKPGYKSSIEISIPGKSSGVGMLVIKSDYHMYSQASYIQPFEFKDNEIKDLASKVKDAISRIETINNWHKKTFREIADDLAKQIARVDRCYKALDYNISADMLLINELQTMNTLFNNYKEVSPENDVEYFVNKGKTGELEPHEVYRLIKHTSETAPIIIPFEKNGLISSKSLFITEHADGNIVLSVCKSQWDTKNYDIKDVKFTNISVAMPQDVAKERLSIMAEKFKHAAMDLEVPAKEALTDKKVEEFLAKMYKSAEGTDYRIPGGDKDLIRSEIKDAIRQAVVDIKNIDDIKSLELNEISHASTDSVDVVKYRIGNCPGTESVIKPFNITRYDPFQNRDMFGEIEYLNYISGNMQDITNKGPEYGECLPEDIEDEYEDELDEFEIEE